jgi:hypothetical protein
MADFQLSVNADALLVCTLIYSVAWVELNCSLQIHRCYLIWGSQLRIGLPLGLACLVVHGRPRDVVHPTDGCLPIDLGVGLAGAIMTIISRETKPSILELHDIASCLNDGYFAANAVVNGFATLMTGIFL